MRHESASSYRTVYSSSPKAVKALLSPDEKNVLILSDNGTVKLMSVSNSGIRTIYNQSGSLAAKDVAWNDNKSFQVQNGNGWRKQSF